LSIAIFVTIERPSLWVVVSADRDSFFSASLKVS